MFKESININLGIRIGSAVFDIPGGNIEKFRLNLFSYGFSGMVGFWIISDMVNDTLFAKFIQPDIIHVHISLLAVHSPPATTPAPLVVKGIVTDKSVREEAIRGVSGKPVLQRYYEIALQDPPAVLWKQHFPSKIYVGKKMKDVILDNTVQGLLHDIDFGALDKKKPMICLGLGDENNDASFYDFLMWYMKSNNGVCLYDYQNQKLSFSGTKPNGKKTFSLKFNEIQTVNISIPETIRYQNRLLNISAESPGIVDIEQAQAVKGLTQDLTIRTDISANVNTQKKLSQSKLGISEPGLEISLSQFPLFAFYPGSFVEFDKEYWGNDFYPNNKKYRIYEVVLAGVARKKSPGQDYNAPFAVYSTEITAKLEVDDNPVAYFPKFLQPKYPLTVEGRIISEKGKDGEKTYQIYKEEKSSREMYSVKVPLWDCRIMAPFISDIATGHFFFPAFTDAKVLLSVYFDNAEIEKFLDWGAGTRLTMDSQGNHLLFGKTLSNNTSMKYEYSENKPVFSMKRILNEDTELIQMEDGNIILQTREED